MGFSRAMFGLICYAIATTSILFVTARLLLGFVFGFSREVRCSPSCLSLSHHFAVLDFLCLSVALWQEENTLQSLLLQ
jgi:hypothetical protein